MKIVRLLFLDENAEFSITKTIGLFGIIVYIHTYIDLWWLDKEYSQVMATLGLEMMLASLGIRGAQRGFQFIGEGIAGKVKDKKLAQSNKTEQTAPVVKTKQPPRKEPIVPLSGNFGFHEFESKDGTPMPANVKRNVATLIGILEVVRAEAGGKPITITSGYRSPAHNKAVNGSLKSEHMTGKAADFKISGMRPKQVVALLERLIAEGKIPDGGIGLYKSWVHYDFGKPRRWNG